MKSVVAAVSRTCGPLAALEYAGAIAAALPAVLRTRSLQPADGWMMRRERTYTVLGQRLTLDGRHFSGAREMYARQCYFANRNATLRPDDVVVDLGANMGLFTLLAAMKCAKVVAVEAQSGMRAEIESLLARHGVAHKAAVETALVGGATGLFSDRERTLAASHARGVVPELLGMDALMEKHELQRIGFLKCDIEGSEFDLFGTAGSWLGRVDRIAMEVHHAYGKPSELERTLAAAGFDVERRDARLERVDSSAEMDGYIYAWRTRS